jgi:hypothetical protein
MSGKKKQSTFLYWNFASIKKIDILNLLISNNLAGYFGLISALLQTID